MVTRSRPALSKLMMICASTLTGTCAMAQSGPLDEVVVVGSRIPQPQDQAVAVTVITSRQIEQRGYATAQQALDDLSHNSGGGFDQQLNFGFTPSAAAVNFRDMGVGRVLILVDGRRQPAFPVGFNGTDSFVDISSIPAVAIDRIEVLSDGASAIYGSDAMSGVVNVVLKKRVGTEAAVRYGNTVHGGGAERRFQFSTGAEAEGSSAAFFLEYYRRETLWYSQRDITESDRLGGVNGSGPGAFSSYGYPGTFVNFALDGTSPSCDRSGGSPGVIPVDIFGFGIDTQVCGFNRAQYRQIWPDSRSLSSTAKFEQVLNDDLTWFTTLRLRDAVTRMQIEPASYNSYLDNNFYVVPATDSPTGEDGLYFRRMVEFGPQRYDYDVNVYSALTGLRGNFGGGYSWEFGVQSARQRVIETAYGQIQVDKINDAMMGVLDLDGNGVNDAPLNLFQRLPGYVVDQLSYTPVSVATTKLTTADFSLTGQLFDIGGRAAKFSTVLEYVNEVYDDDRDPEIIAGNVLGLGGSSGHGERDHVAAGVELSLPLLSRLKLNIAGRYDRYNDDSDVGGAFSPRLAVEFRPIDSLLLRASGGLSFRAPDMQRMFGGDFTSYNTLIDTPGCIADGGSGYGDPNVPSCNTPLQDVQTVTQANIKLKEERGRSFTAGFRWQPNEAFSASADLFHLYLKDLVTTPDLQYALDQNAANGSFDDEIFRDCTLGGGPVCPLVGIVTRAQNVAYKKSTGIDVASDYALNVAGWGRFTVGLTGTYMLDVTMRESIHRAPVDVLSEGKLGESVRVKGGLQLGWQRGAFSSNLFVNYIGAFTPLNTAYVDRIGSYTTVNVNAAYDLPWKGQLQLGVNNLLDRDPPLDLQNGDASLTFYHQQFHDADGAKWFVGYRQGFGGG